jgi:hypothetical protein
LADNTSRFNEILARTIDKTITELFSPTVLTALYEHLEKNYNLTRDELPYRLKTMYIVLDRVFGFKGANIIERRIAKNLCDEFNIPFANKPECTLEMYVEKAKQLG